MQVMGSPPSSPPYSDGHSQVASKRNFPRPVVIIDPATGRGSIPHKEKFHKYPGIPIVHSNWIDVPESLKELVWDEILLKILTSKFLMHAKFDIPKVANAKKKGQDKEDPSVKYGIDSQTWEEFAATRKTPNWQGIRKRAQEIKKHNDCPHLLSHEKIKKRHHEAMLTKNTPQIDDPSSSIERHMTQGSFVPQGCDNILNTAIGRIWCDNISILWKGITWLKHLLHIHQPTIEKTRNEIEEENKQTIEKMKQELNEAIKIELSERGSPYTPSIDVDMQVLSACISTKGSNAKNADNALGEEHDANVILTMGLYMQGDNCTCLEALGNIYDGESTIHNMAYTDDVVRVSVQKIYDDDAKALDTFIAWLTNLVKVVSHEDSHVTPKKVAKHVQMSNDVGAEDLLRQLIRTLYDIYDKHVEFCCGIGSIHNAKDRHAECQHYIETWVKESQRELVVLCPMKDVVIWLCLLRKKPDIHIKVLVNNAMKTLKSSLDGHIDKVATQWIEIKSRVQIGGYECGYYVMYWMWNIVSGGLKNDWSMACPMGTWLQSFIRALSFLLKVLLIQVPFSIGFFSLSFPNNT
ncbi:hypothetical protein HKD37_18G050493 [Glycine soja]